MIRSFRHKGVEEFYRSGRTHGIQAKHAKRLRLQLARLSVARVPGDMAAPGWTLHPRMPMPYWWTIRTTTEGRDMTQMHNPPHPGEVLREWLEGVTVTEAAARLGVTRVALSRVLNGAAGVSAEMDLRLSKALRTSPGTWYAMQGNFDMWQAQRRFRGKVRPITPAPATS